MSARGVLQHRCLVSDDFMGDEIIPTSDLWRGSAAELICVASKEKSRSWVEMRERRSAVSLFVRRSLKGGH